MTKDEKCKVCKVILIEGEDLRFNGPGGPKCMDCYDKKPKKQPRYIKLAGHKIPSKMLSEYASKVEMTRNAAQVGSRDNDPIVIMRALQNRVDIHKKIFAIAGYDHDDTSKGAMKIREALEEWLEENIFIKPQCDGLV